MLRLGRSVRDFADLISSFPRRAMPSLHRTLA